MKVFNLVFAVLTMAPCINTFNTVNHPINAVQQESCEAPLRQPTALEFTQVTMHTVQARFTSVERADNYLVLRSNKHRLSVLPQNNSRYQEGDELGDAVVVSYAAEERFTATQLEQNTSYYFFVFAVNDECVNGPVYNTYMPLSDKIVTKPAF